MKQNEWIREPPTPPPKAPSDWYWFWSDKEKEPFVMEVWPDRKYWPDGWWGRRVPPPKINPRKKEN